MSESVVQSTFIKWCWINMRRYPELRLGFAVPNGAWTKNVRSALKLKREGLRAGVPDWMLPVRNHLMDKIGLAIEFKFGKNKLTKEQAEYQELLKGAGWQVETCYDWKVAASIVEEYLK